MDLSLLSEGLLQLGGSGVSDMSSFPSTHWSEVVNIGHLREESRRSALDSLLRRYLPPMKVHLVARKGIRADEAEDLLQSFVADKVLQKDLIARADQRKGKFRTFLLTSLDRFVIDRGRWESVRTKTLQADHLDPIDEASIAAPCTDVVDLAWAREVLAAALRNLEEECREAGRTDMWEVFRARVVGPAMDGEEPPPYADLVRRFGLESPVQASNILVSGKRAFLRHLRRVVGEYAIDDCEVGEEIAALRSVVARSIPGAASVLPGTGG